MQIEEIPFATPHATPQTKNARKQYTAFAAKLPDYISCNPNRRQRTIA